MKKNSLIALGLASVALFSCQSTQKNASTQDSTAQQTTDSTGTFAGEIEGNKIDLYTLTNPQRIKATFTNFGARIVSLQVPDKDGKLVDVVLGFNTAAEYNNPKEGYYGAVVGPFGNRIAKGKFTLNGKEYTLPQNNGGHTLHGGNKGVHFQNWTGEQTNDSTITFAYTLPDEAEGFPGNLNIKVTYALRGAGLQIDYHATTDKESVVNLTNHAYFNLNGEGSGTILNHELQILADKYTPVDQGLIPTGELAPVKSTPFDFTTAKTIGRDIETKNEQLTFGKGYDHNWVLNGTKVGGLNHAAKLTGDASGIVMDIYTEEPGLQFYSGNFMASTVTLKDGSKDDLRTGLCLETQHFPDSPNQPDFPTTVLKPGETYKTKTIYAFSVKK